MKSLYHFVAALTLLIFSFAPNLARAQDDSSDDQGASFQTFYDQLGQQGNWVQTDDYGYVFQPNVSDPNWAPYTDGHWVYTDQGWTWVSDEPWGWATYHYGRWANIDGTGWVWVPGYRWAPAWVSWRYGGGYCGWAPLPPESFVGAEYGGSGGWASFHFGGDVDVSFGIGAGCYNFVNVGDMGEPNYRGRYIDRSRNYTVINNTTNITNININRNGTGFQGVVAKGPSLNDVNAHSHQRVSTVQLAAANQPGRSNVQGNSLAVYAPRMNPASVHTAKPAAVSQTLSHPAFNRGTSITKPLEVSASVRAPAPSPEAIHAAEEARLHAPSKAKIATEKTAMAKPMSKPLISMEPVIPVHPKSSASANAPFTGESVTPGTPQPRTEVQPSVAPGTQPKTASNPDQAQQEARHQQQVQAEQEARQKQQALAQQEARQQQVRSAQEASQQQQAQAQQEARQKQEALAQQEARQKQQAQAQQEARQPQPAPAATYHPSSAPAPATYHPQSEPSHESAPPPHVQPPPANKPAAGHGDKKPAGDKNQPQGQ